MTLLNILLLLAFVVVMFVMMKKGGGCCGGGHSHEGHAHGDDHQNELESGGSKTDTDPVWKRGQACVIAFCTRIMQ